MFQIYWPPLPGQTEECFRKGKDPGVSLTPRVLCPELGGSPCALMPAGSPCTRAVLCHPTGDGPVGALRPVNAGAEQGTILVHEGN